MKDRKMAIMIAGIILLMIGLSVLKSKGPKPIDWDHTFYNTKTDPYGTYITYQLLGEIFDKQNIRSTRMPVYNNVKKDVEQYFYPDEEYGSYMSSSQYGNYKDTYEEGYLIQHQIQAEKEKAQNPNKKYQDLDNLTDTTSFIFINTYFKLDKLDQKYLLNFVGLGNNVFISAESFDKSFLDTLNIKSKVSYKQDSIYSLTDYKEKRYRFEDMYGQTRFNTDSCKLPVRVLAKNKGGDTVFVDIKYGKGHIYLHAIPTAFANVNMLKTRRYDFAFRSLSYLPENSKIIWDEYQKQGALGEGSTFKMMLSNPPLRVALYLILAGFLLFMIFRSKRTQRIIPVINPPVNSSLEFLGTISNLYYRKKDFKTIIDKRHAYFLDFIRKHYYMSTELIDDDFVKNLSAKSGVDKDQLVRLFLLYKDLSTLAFIPNEAFLKYNSMLEEFYKKVQTNKN